MDPWASRRPGRFAARRRILRGFSLLELIIVLSIIGLLASVAIPRYANSLTRQRADVAAQRVARDLQMAQRAAQQSSSGLRITFDVATSSYRLVGLADPDHPTGDYAVDLRQPPYEVTVQSAVFGGDASVVLDGFGAPDSAGSVVVGANDQWRDVSIAADTGQVTVTELAAAPVAPAETPLKAEKEEKVK